MIDINRTTEPSFLPEEPQPFSTTATDSQANPTAPSASPAEEAPHSDLLRTDDYSEYLLHSRREIISLLGKVAEHGDLVTVYFNEGKDFLLTTLLDLDEVSLRLDKGSNGEMNRRALDAQKLFCVTKHAKVKLQFLLTGLTEINKDGQKVFQANLPETLLRLQRRAFYRLTTPITRPLICQVPMQFADGHSEIISVNIVDVSAGGVAMLAPPEGIPFEEDMAFPGCILELPEMGTINATLKVRNVFEITLRNGSRVKRSGCEFINIPPTSQTLIQRYIIKIERERKARESGLA